LETKIQEQKFEKSKNKNYKNLGIKITKIREQNKNLGNKITKIQKQKF
jgi:nucleoside-triphosphatase THEP1